MNSIRLLLTAAILILIIGSGVLIMALTNNPEGTTTSRQTRPQDLPEIDLAVPSELATASFGLGCFWGPEASFGVVEGVYRTRVGYAGGTKHNPSYHDLGDHTETVQVDFDPAIVSYEQLIIVFLDTHNPFAPSWSRQYMSAVFFHNESQKETAERVISDYQSKHTRTVQTRVLPVNEFYLAEDYHQKYLLQLNRQIMQEYNTIFSVFQDFVNSTSAARANGFVTGKGSIELLNSSLPLMGLSEQAQQVLRRAVARQK